MMGKVFVVSAKLENELNSAIEVVIAKIKVFIIVQIKLLLIVFSMDFLCVVLFIHEKNSAEVG